MNNKGFSILECVFCLMLISFTSIGFFNILFFVNQTNAKNEYESILYNNLKAILEAGDIDPGNHKFLLTQIYEDNVKLISDDTIQITVYLDNKYNGEEMIVYVVKFEETTNNYFATVTIENIINEYEEINNELFTKRIYPK